MFCKSSKTALCCCLQVEVSLCIMQTFESHLIQWELRHTESGTEVSVGPRSWAQSLQYSICTPIPWPSFLSGDTFRDKKGRQSTKHPLTGSENWSAHWKHPKCQEHEPRWDQEILTASSEGLTKGKCVHLLFGAQIALPYDNTHYLICKGQWIALQFLPNACAMNFVIFHTHFSAKNWWYRFEA